MILTKLNTAWSIIFVRSFARFVYTTFSNKQTNTLHMLTYRTYRDLSLLMKISLYQNDNVPIFEQILIDIYSCLREKVFWYQIGLFFYRILSKFFSFILSEILRRIVLLIECKLSYDLCCSIMLIINVR